MTFRPVPRQPAFDYEGVVRTKLTFPGKPTIIVDFGSIPAYASVIGGGVQIVTAFNAGANNTLDVGFRGGSATDDPDAYATALTLAGVGLIVLDEIAATTNIMNTTSVILTCRFNGTGAAATTGLAYLTVRYTVGNTDGSS